MSDGATGTYLQARGLEAGACPEEFNANHPEIVRQMAADYFAAGSDMVETNSFGGTRYMLAKHGLADRVEELNRLAAEHARSAAPPGRFVLGSMGPTGEFLEPMGTATEDDLYEAFAEQARGLAAGGVDALCLETVTDFGEARAAIRAIRDTTQLPVLATMSFDQGARGYATMMGVTPAEAAEKLSEAGADAVGANCGIAIEQVIEVVAAMRAVTDKPIVTHVNAGMPRVQGGRTVYPDTPERMASRVRELVDAGANVVGGCCGTGPDHIRAFVKVLRG